MRRTASGRWGLSSDDETLPHRSMNTSLLLSFPTVILAGIGLAGLECHAPGGPDELPAATFVAQPAAVAPGDSFAVVFTLRNPTRDTVTIGSAYGCLFFLRAYRGSDQVAMQGTRYGCTAAFRRFAVPPGDSLRIVHDLVAAELTPLPPGTYRIQTQMNAALPDLEAEVIVVDRASGS